MLEMIERSKRTKIDVESETGDVFRMSLYEYSRWLSLLEAIDVVDQGARRMKVDLDDPTVDWVQPIAFEKFVRDRYLDMLTHAMSDSDTQRKIVKQLCTLSPDTSLLSTQEALIPETVSVLESSQE